MVMNETEFSSVTNLLSIQQICNGHYLPSIAVLTMNRVVTKSMPLASGHFMSHWDHR